MQKRNFRTLMQNYAKMKSGTVGGKTVITWFIASVLCVALLLFPFLNTFAIDDVEPVNDLDLQSEIIHEPIQEEAYPDPESVDESILADSVFESATESALISAIDSALEPAFGPAIGPMPGPFPGGGIITPGAPFIPIVPAASGGATIDMTDGSPPVSGIGWTYANNLYTILNGANVTVSGFNGSTQRSIAIAANATATVTLNGASIDVSAQSGQSPVLLNSGANLTLIITGTNSLMAGQASAGIQVPSGTTLTISSASTGSLTSLGGTAIAIYGPGGGAGIGTGGGPASITGTINIAGGTITATGADNGAGIGGGADSSVGTITISGGNITATGGSWGGAGIGGGSAYNGGTGTNGAGGNITISGGTVTANGGNTSSNSGAGGGAGIGGAGANNSAWGATSTSGASGNITISGSAAVTADGGNGGADGGGAGIGSGGQGGTGAVGQAGMTSGLNTLDINPLTTPVNTQGGTSTNSPPTTWNGASVGFGGGSNPPLTTTSSQMLPAAPTNLVASLQTSGDVTLTWSPPASLTGISLTYVILLDGNPLPGATAVSASTYTVPAASLSPGAHTFAVRAQTQYSAIGPQVSATLSPVVFTSANNTNVTSGTVGTFQVTATGTTPITYTLSGAPANVTIDPATGVMTIASTVSTGTSTFTITANAGFLSATQSFTLTVTALSVAPDITSANNTTIVSGTGGTFQVTATGTPPITYSLTGAGLPSGVSIDPASGLINIPPTVPVGSYTFTITASGVSPVATQNFTLTVNPAPVPVTITSSNSKSVVNGTGGTLQVTATGTTPITYSLTGAPSGVSIDITTGLLTTAGTVPVGTYTFTITGSNAVPSSATQTFTLSVTPAPVPISINSSAGTGVLSNTGGTFQVTATGTMPITYTLSGAPAGVTLDGSTGNSTTMTIPDTVPAGTYTFSITASNAVNTATQTFTLIDTNPPVAPTITSLSNTSVVNGTGGTFQVTATGTTPFTYSVINPPTGVSIDSASGLMTITGSVPTGIYAFVITVTNGTGPDATQSFRLAVTDAPLAPVITSSNAKGVTSSTGGTFQVTVTGTTPIAYSLTGAPAGVSIDGASGLVTIAASTVPLGTYTFTINASNLVGTATQAFTLSVTATPVAPTITSKNNASFVNGTGGTFKVTATGSIPFTYSLTGAPDGVNIISTNGTISVRGTVPVGTYTFTVTVSNGTASDATQTFTLTQTTAPVAPAITSANSARFVSGTGGTFRVVSTGTSPITYTLTGAPAGVSINSANGIITIAGTVPAGTYNITITASNAVGTVNQAFTLTITAPGGGTGGGTAPPSGGGTGGGTSSTAPGGTNQNIPPNPNTPGNQIVSDGSGGYTELDSDGNIVGSWAWDSSLGQWVFTPSQPSTGTGSGTGTTTTTEPGGTEQNVPQNQQDTTGAQTPDVTEQTPPQQPTESQRTGFFTNPRNIIIVIIIVILLLAAGLVSWWIIAKKRKHRKQLESRNLPD